MIEIEIIQGDITKLNVDAIVKNVTVKMIAIAKNVIVKTAVANYR